MLMSMTGFGRSVFEAPFGRVVVEIQSVNRKYLEMFVSLPKEFGRFENDIRKWLSEAISRGQISVRVHVMPSAAAVQESLPNIELLRELKYGWERIAQQLQIDPKSIDLSFLMQYLPSQSKLDLAKDEDLPVIHRCVDEALQGLVQMKKAEGKALAKDLTDRLKLLESHLAQIEQLAPDSSKKVREKLLEKMGEILKAGPETEERLFREAALMAEKADVAEEITRLKSHFKQFQELFSPKAGGVGRKMDFLVQEMGREINTIGSKTAEAKISYLVVEMKSELDRIREQIQNIE